VDGEKFLDNDVKIATDTVAHVAQNHATEAKVRIHKHQELIENRLRSFHVSLAG
jgi:ferritin-like protein